MEADNKNNIKKIIKKMNSLYEYGDYNLFFLYFKVIRNAIIFRFLRDNDVSFKEKDFDEISRSNNKLKKYINGSKINNKKKLLAETFTHKSNKKIVELANKLSHNNAGSNLIEVDEKEIRHLKKRVNQWLKYINIKYSKLDIKVKKISLNPIRKMKYKISYKGITKRKIEFKTAYLQRLISWSSERAMSFLEEIKSKDSEILIKIFYKNDIINVIDGQHRIICLNYIWYLQTGEKISYSILDKKIDYIKIDSNSNSQKIQDIFIKIKCWFLEGNRLNFDKITIFFESYNEEDSSKVFVLTNNAPVLKEKVKGFEELLSFINKKYKLSLQDNKELFEAFDKYFLIMKHERGSIKKIRTYYKEVSNVKNYRIFLGAVILSQEGEAHFFNYEIEIRMLNDLLKNLLKYEKNIDKKLDEIHKLICYLNSGNVRYMPNYEKTILMESICKTLEGKVINTLPNFIKKIEKYNEKKYSEYNIIQKITPDSTYLFTINEPMQRDKYLDSWNRGVNPYEEIYFGNFKLIQFSRESKKWVSSSSYILESKNKERFLRVPKKSKNELPCDESIEISQGEKRSDVESLTILEIIEHINNENIIGSLLNKKTKKIDKSLTFNDLFNIFTKIEKELIEELKKYVYNKR